MSFPVMEWVIWLQLLQGNLGCVRQPMEYLLDGGPFSKHQPSDHEKIPSSGWMLKGKLFMYKSIHAPNPARIPGGLSTLHASSRESGNIKII